MFLTHLALERIFWLQIIAFCSSEFVHLIKDNIDQLKPKLSLNSKLNHPTTHPATPQPTQGITLIRPEQAQNKTENKTKVETKNQSQTKPTASPKPRTEP